MTALPWDLDNLTIRRGQHPKPPNGGVEACAMEAVYLRWAGRQGWDKQRTIAGWTDALECVCPVLAAFVRSWNDGMGSDEDRTRVFTAELLDLLPDTRGGDDLMLRRMWMAIDWDIRVKTPAFLRLANLESCAAALESLPEIRGQEDLVGAEGACREAGRQGAAARDAARAAAVAAARGAAGDAAYSAAGAAAWAAARAAAWAAAGAAAGDAADDAAWAAAWDAAGDAAGDAAYSAAWAALRPTVVALQSSAAELLRRMCGATGSGERP